MFIQMMSLTNFIIFEFKMSVSAIDATPIKVFIGIERI